jgi:plasmid stabilization system protein ParE
MKIRWSPDAAADFAGIVEFIHKQNRQPRTASRAPCTKAFPHSNRSLIVGVLAALVLSPLRFVVVYRVKPEGVEIARVLHGSQRWP